MTVELLDEAEEEFLEAVLQYESLEIGLGKRFRDEVALVLHQISGRPFLWREREGGYRRVNCPVFPFYIPYFIRKENIIIAAVAHGHREPNYWKSRMDGQA